MFQISYIPAFKDNYIWVLQRGQEAFVVDPGEAAPVQAHLAAAQLRLAGILVTHHHADHQGGVAELAAYWSCPVFAPADESITGASQHLRGGETIDVLGVPVSVLAIPGHTRGHLGYLAPTALFCGDTLFGAGCGRLFEGTPQQMHAALACIAALPAETRIYCAHEYTQMNLPFALAVEPENPAILARLAQVDARRQAGLPTVPLDLAEELATNPFLRCDQPAVIAAARAHGAASADPVEVFAALRAWRNVFA